MDLANQRAGDHQILGCPFPQDWETACVRRRQLRALVRLCKRGYIYGLRTSIFRNSSRRALPPLPGTARRFRVTERLSSICTPTAGAVYPVVVVSLCIPKATLPKDGLF